MDGGTRRESRIPRPTADIASAGAKPLGEKASRRLRLAIVNLGPCMEPHAQSRSARRARRAAQPLQPACLTAGMHGCAELGARAQAQGSAAREHPGGKAPHRPRCGNRGAPRCGRSCASSQGASSRGDMGGHCGADRCAGPAAVNPSLAMDAAQSQLHRSRRAVRVGLGPHACAARMCVQA
jgi:hypothetical protein